jgi:hypothetical protein
LLSVSVVFLLQSTVPTHWMTSMSGGVPHNIYEGVKQWQQV